MVNFQSAFRLLAIASITLLWLVTAGGCGSSQVAAPRPGYDENLARLNRSARIAYDNGQLEQAANLYRQALDRAYMRDDRDAIVDARYNLAVCMLGLRSYDTALVVLRQAKSELARDRHPISADILLLEATILYRADQSDEAWQITDRILTEFDPAPAMVKNKTHYLRGVISAQRGETARLGREINALPKSSDPGFQADRQELTGRLAMAEGRWDEAIEAFDDVVRLRREKLDYAEMAQALALGADACHKAGKHSAAATRYFRAGRSAAQQGNGQDAKMWLSSAARSAEQAGDEVLKQEIRTYLETVQIP
jgi:tetratricopeptide (TPR) repeat protein